MRSAGWIAGTILLYGLASLWYHPWKHKEPDLAASHLRLAADDMRRGRRDLAIAEAEAAVRVDPGHAIAHYNLGCYLLDAGRRAEAEREFVRTLELAPDAELPRMQLQRLRALTAPGS